MEGFQRTKLWGSAFAERDDDRHADPRRRLEAALFAFRARAKVLAAMIPEDLHDFTTHDITHSDGLWEMADIIAGAEVDLTPTEAFVLGGAFLVHDLGLALATYPSGSESLREEDRWLDTVAALLSNYVEGTPAKEEISNPPEDIRLLAKEAVLRELHAERATHLVDTSWRDLERDETYYLLEDADLRRDYGPLIGELAASHGWSVSKLPACFPTQYGAPVWCPPEWTIQPIKLAALLRVADAAHVTAARAPGFARALRKPSDPSRRHWVFQEHLHRPIADGDRLKYTSTRAFPLSEAASWWLCLDTLRMVDTELRQSDALLADMGHKRFQIRGVANVDSPERLATLIRTDGWLPIDTRLEVGDVAGLIERLGGEELYGNDPKVPLRELIQNASDAVRARIAIGDITREQGRVLVRLESDENGHWLEVEDNGVGMSQQLLVGPLLDFGRSYWGSTLMRRELPGLLSRGFQATGRYGIGFFSVFMWGKRVTVTSRHYDESREDTRVLDFENGVRSRPILRPASVAERIRDGGTRVRVWLDDEPAQRGGLLWRSDPRQRPWSLSELCEWLCPASEVGLWAAEGGGEPKVIVGPSDWINVDAEKLLLRGTGSARGSGPYELDKEVAQIFSGNVRPLLSDTGDIVGRACILPGETYGYRAGDFPEMYTSATVAVGGLRTGIIEPGLHGVFVGTSTRAARDVAVPVVENEELARWASEQAHLLGETIKNPLLQCASAEVVAALLGDTGDLAVALSARGWLTGRHIRAWCMERDEVLVADLYDVLGTYEDQADAELHQNVLGTEISNRPFLRDTDRRGRRGIDWPAPSGKLSEREWSLFWIEKTIRGVIAAALAEGWCVTFGQVMDNSTYFDNDREEREIGNRSGRPVVREVTVFRRVSLDTTG